MKPSCIIVEDEPLARDFLRKYCEKSNLLDLKGTFPDAEQALSFLHNNEIEIVFLDVEMPGANGFQLLDQLLYMPKVILTSSKTEYAFTAFQYNVSDYLKKPIPYNRFIEAVNKVIQLLDSTTVETTTEDIFIKSEGKLIRLSYDEILYIESMGDYVKYITENKKYLTHSTLKAVEDKMDKKHFLKVHRSYIVNARKIKDIQDNNLVINGNVIPISKSHKQEVLERLKIL